METIGKRLKEVRVKLGITQTQFAEGIGLTYVVISKIESAARTPSYNVLMAVAEKYNISLDWLTYGRGTMNILPPDHIVNEMDDDWIEFLTVFRSLPEDVQDKLFGVMADFVQMILEAEKRGAL